MAQGVRNLQNRIGNHTLWVRGKDMTDMTLLHTRPDIGSNMKHDLWPKDHLKPPAAWLQYISMPFWQVDPSWFAFQTGFHEFFVWLTFCFESCLRVLRVINISLRIMFWVLWTLSNRKPQNGRETCDIRSVWAPLGEQKEFMPPCLLRFIPTRP